MISALVWSVSTVILWPLTFLIEQMRKLFFMCAILLIPLIVPPLLFAYDTLKTKRPPTIAFNFGVPGIIAGWLGGITFFMFGFLAGGIAFLSGLYSGYVVVGCIRGRLVSRSAL